MSGSDETAPMSAGAPVRAASLGAGHMFGRYLIVDRVGAGGAGEVYAAYDPNLDRRVALKVLRGRASGDEATSRPSPEQGEPGRGGLVREAQALAKLSHPNVVGVHDVGVVDDRTFIAMELVDGVDLSEWLRRDPTPGWRETLATMIQAGRGLAAAHAKQTIHCDFKPANVLVGDDGRVRVSDFGLAQLLSPTQRAAVDEPVTEALSVEGQAGSSTLPPGQGIAGTPNYMAPEQHRGEAASIASDVYSFCLTAYEALFGRRPFGEHSSLEALAEAKMAGPPVPPSSTSVPRRVRQALVRGLQPDPSLRWTSMPPLLAALSPDSTTRTRGAAMALAVGAVASVGAFAYAGGPQPCTGSASYLDGVWDDARRAALSKVFDDHAQTFVSDSSRRVEGAVDGYADAWIDARTQACMSAERGEHSQQWLDRTTECLDGGRQRLDALLGVLLRGDAVALEHALAAVQGLPSARACAEHHPGLPPPSDEALAKTVVQQRARLAEVAALVRTGLNAEALPLAESVAEVATASGYLPLRAEALHWLGKAQVKMGDAETGEATLTDAVWTAHESGHAQMQINVATYLTFVVGARRARPEDAEWWARYARAEIDRQGASPRVRSLLEHNRGSSALEASNFDAAERHYRDALQILEDAGLEHTVRYASTIDNLGIVVRNRGEPSQAIEHHRRALAAREAALGSEHPDVTASLSNLAAAMVDRGDLEEAHGIQQRVLKIHEAAYGPVHPSVAIAVNNLGVYAFRQGRDAEAERLFRRAYEIRRETMPGHPKVAGTLSLVATTVAKQGRHAEAKQLYDDVVALQRNHGQSAGLSTTLNNLASLYIAQDRLDEAAAAYREAIELSTATMGAKHPDVVRGLTNLGLLLRRQGRHAEALETLEKVLELAQSRANPDPRAVAYALDSLGGAQREAGDPQAAIETLERALPLVAALEAAVDLQGSIDFELAQALVAAGRGRARARALVESAKARYQASGEYSERVAELDAWLAGPG